MELEGAGIAPFFFAQRIPPDCLMQDELRSF